MNDKLHCICCCREMDNIMAGKGHQPNDGLSFHTYGHYGSTFFDLLDGSAIQIAVCDECLEEADKKGLIARPKGKNLDYSWDAMKPVGNEFGSDEWEVDDGPAF